MDNALALVAVMALKAYADGRDHRNQMPVALRYLKAIGYPGISENVGRFEAASRGLLGKPNSERRAALLSAIQAIEKFIE